MKKVLLTALLFVMISAGAKAQFILGIKAGANISKIRTDDIKASEVTGYQAGIFMRAGQGLFFQPEIYLSGTGGKFDFQTNNNTVIERGKVRFTNLNVPLLIGQSFGHTNLNFRIMAGPVYTAIVYKDKSFSQNIQAAYKDFNHYSNSTLGYQAGVGFDIAAFTLDARYEGGLTKLNSDYGERQNLWSLSIGFKVL